MKYYDVAESAQKDADYQLYSDNGCRLEGDEDGECVSFSPGQTQAVLRVRIMNDTLLEGNEVFYLKIEYVRNGQRDKKHYQLKVTIRDGAQRQLITYKF